LARGAAEARAQIDAGRIVGAALSLQGHWRVVGAIGDCDDTREVELDASAARPRRLRDDRIAAVC